MSKFFAPDAKVVYISGPYTKGGKLRNVLKMLQVAERLVKEGIAVKVPHLTHFWDRYFTHPYEFWMELDEIDLLSCDAVLRVEGESAGADREVKLAQKVGIPVFTDEKAVIRFCKDGTK